jgi:serine protease
LHRIPFVPLRLLVACLALFAIPAPAHAQAETEPGHVIVRWRAESLRRPLHQVAGRRVVHARPIGDGYWIYHLDERTAQASHDAIHTLRALPEVELAEPNHIRQPFKVPNDPLYQLLWNLRAANLEKAWDRTTGSAAVVVAVVDTGIRADHPDLVGRTLSGYDLISEAASAGDNDGPDANAKDEGSEQLTSSGLHGTHVAGIIGAAANNKTGIAGVNWTCKILPVRALGVHAGKGNDGDIAAAIKWAAGIEVPNIPLNTTPAKVINLSFGGPGFAQVLADAVKAAQAKGSIVVVAAGNQNQDVAGAQGLPAIYPAALPNVVTVGATDYNGKRAPYSNYGTKIIVMAPGGDLQKQLPFPFDDGTGSKNYPAGILSTLYNTSKQSWGYQMYEGTSQAAPLVAGIVSLMLAVNPSLDTKETIRILQTTANPAGKCDEGCGPGIVDADKALAMTGGSGKLPFGVTCSADSECGDGVCRTVQGAAGKICTQYCSIDSNCPAGAPCKVGMCTPSGSQPQTCTGDTCFTPGTVVGGCAVGSTTTSSRLPTLALLLGAILVLGWRRRR